MSGSRASSSGGGIGGDGVPRPASIPPVSNASEGYFERERGLRLYHCEFLPEQERVGAAARGRAAVALLHGFGEHSRRYDEFAVYLMRRGHAVSCFDARGHGRSDGPRGHALSQRQYVDDAAVFTERVAARHPDRPLIVLGHSHGGLVAVRALQQGLAGVRGLVLTGPLLGLRSSRKVVPDAVARVLSWAVPWLPLPNGIHARDLTHDAERREAHAQDAWVHGVATPRWYWSMLVAARDALEAAPTVTLPLLIVQGELDPVVDPARVAEFHARAGSTDKQLIVRPGELHEVLNETARVELFETIARWIERVASGPEHPAG